MKAHLKQSICFVEHHVLNGAQFEIHLDEHVQQTTGSGDDQIGEFQ